MNLKNRVIFLLSALLPLHTFCNVDIEIMRDKELKIQTATYEFIEKVTDHTYYQTLLDKADKVTGEDAQLLYNDLQTKKNEIEALRYSNSAYRNGDGPLILIVLSGLLLLNRKYGGDVELTVWLMVSTLGNVIIMALKHVMICDCERALEGIAVLEDIVAGKLEAV
jgi:hypothetical protein